MGLKGVRNLTKLALGLLTHPESEAEILALAQDFTGTAAGSRAGEGGFYACIYPCRAPRKCIREPHTHTCCCSSRQLTAREQRPRVTPDRCKSPRKDPCSTCGTHGVIWDPPGSFLGWGPERRGCCYEPVQNHCLLHPTKHRE